MPRFKIAGFGEDVVDNKGGSFTPYDGDLPPKGVIFSGLVRQLQLVVNKSQQPMIKLIVEIKEPNNSPNAKYNGAIAWHNLNCTDQGSGYVNDFLDALSGANRAVKEKFWLAGPNLQDKAPPSAIIGIGPLKIKEEGMPIRFASGHKANFKDKTKTDMIVTAFLPAKASSEDDEPGEVEDDVDDGIVDDDDTDAVEVEEDDDADDVQDEEVEEEVEHKAQLASEPPF